MSFMDRGRRGPAVDVGALLDVSSVEYLSGLVELGVLVSLSRSRDGGAFAVTITYDGDYVREWFREAEELHDWLKEALEELTHEIGAASTDHGPRKRSRKPR